MKKFVISIVLAFMGVCSSYAANNMRIQLTGFPNDNIGNVPITRAPIEPITIEQDGNTLTFRPFADTFCVQLIDSNDDKHILYSDVVPSGVTSYSLPTSLSGTYTIRIIYGIMYYYGEISL